MADTPNDPSALNPRPAQTVPNAVPAAAQAPAAQAPSNPTVQRPRSPITNPSPARDAGEDAPVTPPEGTDAPEGLPASTRAEMEAGKDALDRNKPRPAAPSNPVDDLAARKSGKAE